MILDLSNLRLIGFLAGVLLLFSIVLDLRRHRDRRVSRAPFIVFALALMAIGADPDLVDAPARFVGLSEIQGGRILSLVLISVLLVWPLALQNRTRVAESELNILAAIRQFAIMDFRANYSDSVPRGTVWVVIPVLNEADNIPVVLQGLPERCCDVGVTALVVNDGSTDESAAVARDNGAYVANLPFNCGGGAALKVGFELALASGASAVVTMDGDGQHDPAEVSALAQPICRDEADVVIGSRVLGEEEAYFGLRTVGVRVFSRIINALSGSEITDCSSGYRAMSPAIIQAVPLLERQYHTPELIIGASKRGARITEVPIRIRNRLSGTSKKGPDLQYGWRFARSIIRAFLR